MVRCSLTEFKLLFHQPHEDTAFHSALQLAYLTHVAEHPGHRQISRLPARGADGSHLDNAASVKQALDERGLSVSSAHVGIAALRERFDVVMQACKTLGFTQLFMPSVPPEERQSPEPYWTFLGRELGQMAWRARDKGIELGYHNHNWELRVQADGRTALQCMFTGAGTHR
jgi:Xylose isomerase-like TIM barrel.